MLSRREAVFLIVLFVATLPAVTARLYSSDEVQYYAYLRSLWFDHDVSFENEYRYFYEHHIAQSADFYQTFLVRSEAGTGRRINYGTMGCAILWSPFYAAADLTARALGSAGRDFPADGYSRPYVVAVAYGSAFYGFAAIVLSIVAARRLVGGHAVTSGLAVWAATPLLFYMYIAPPFSHACSAFAVALFVTIWLNVRRTWSAPGAVALGLAGALMVMVREQDIFFVAGPAVDFAVAFATAVASRFNRTGAVASRVSQASGGYARWVAAAAAGGIAVAIGYLPQLLAYKSLNGRWGPSPLVTRKMSWHSPHAVQVLVDTGHGFFFWTPLAVLALAGLIVMTAAPRARGGSPHDNPAEIRRIGSCMLLMVAMQIYVSGVVESWTVAGAFGQRRFVAITIFLVVGIAALREAIRGRPDRKSVV